MTSERRYLPAAGSDAFLPLYDPITRLFGFERALHVLVNQAEIPAGSRLLDVGCGTGTLAVLVKRVHPDADVVGIDPDEKALARARRKAERAGIAVRFERGFADALTYPDASFDRVFSSMMFHHLQREDKTRALSEMRRVLKRDGRLEFLDFAGSGHSLLAKLLHGRQSIDANAEERLLRRMADAGFVNARRVTDRATLFGRIAYYEASAS